MARRRAPSPRSLPRTPSEPGDSAGASADPPAYRRACRARAAFPEASSRRQPNESLRGDCDRRNRQAARAAPRRARLRGRGDDALAAEPACAARSRRGAGRGRWPRQGLGYPGRDAHRAGGRRARDDRPCGCHEPEALRRRVRDDEPSPHGRDGPPGRSCAQGTRTARRRAELRQLELRTDRRPGEEGERPARPRSARLDEAEPRRDPAPRVGRRRRERPRRR